QDGRTEGGPTGGVAKVCEPLAAAADDGQVELLLGGTGPRGDGRSGQPEGPGPHRAEAPQRLAAIQRLRHVPPPVTEHSFWTPRHCGGQAGRPDPAPESMEPSPGLVILRAEEVNLPGVAP